jgi:hypothetical protein
MSVFIPTVCSAHRTAPRRAALPSKNAEGAKNISAKHSIKYAAIVAAGVALFGLLSPANAAARRSDLSSVGSVSVSSPAAEGGSGANASLSGQDAAKPLTSHLPWLAPVGHRQPRLTDIPPDKSLTARLRAQECLNAQLDQKLIICRC